MTLMVCPEKYRRLAGAVCIAGLCAGPVVAQDLRWSYEITPYLWAAGQSGEVGVGGLPSAEVDLSFSEILEDLNMAAMVFGAATYGRYGVFGDIQYITTKADIESSRGFVSGESTTSTFIATLGGEYVALKTPRSELRLMAGVRQWALTAEIDATLLGRDRSVDGDNSWVDGVLGLRASQQVSDAGSLTGTLLIGAGGSDSMADVFVGYNHQLTDTTSLVVGYRHVRVDRDDGDFRYDIRQDGILFGARFVFD